MRRLACLAALALLAAGCAAGGPRLEAVNEPAPPDAILSPLVSAGRAGKCRARGPERSAICTYLNQWRLAGEWTPGAEKATLERANGSIAFRFHARDAHLVLSRNASEP